MFSYIMFAIRKMIEQKKTLNNRKGFSSFIFLSLLKKNVCVTELMVIEEKSHPTKFLQKYKIK